MAGDLVDNPFYTKLERAVRDVRRDAEYLESALSKPVSLMASRRVWVADRGGAAQTFQSGLEGQHRSLKAAVRAVVQAAETALRNTPRQVTREQAALGGRGPQGLPPSGGW